MSVYFLLTIIVKTPHAKLLSEAIYMCAYTYAHTFTLFTYISPYTMIFNLLKRRHWLSGRLNNWDVQRNTISLTWRIFSLLRWIQRKTATRKGAEINSGNVDQKIQIAVYRRNTSVDLMLNVRTSMPLCYILKVCWECILGVLTKIRNSHYMK